MPSTTGLDLNSPHCQALEYVSDCRFHRRFLLPATAEHGVLPITYADCGATGDDAPTVLFIPGMFGSRYIGMLYHRLATKVGVRLLVVDRPGMGGSASVQPAQRIPVWLEIVPALLQHLSIAHVVLVSHSAGTIYLLNTISRLPHVLSPRRPYIAFLAPFVDPAHSKVTAMTMAQLLPTPAFKLWDGVVRFMVLRATPMIGASGTVISHAKDALPSDCKHVEDGSSNQTDSEGGYGMSKELKLEVQKCLSKFMFEEQTAASNDEAMLCLKKGPVGCWASCEDYATCVAAVAEAEREVGIREEKLKVQAFFAETDMMSGKKGQAYFEECWTQSGLDDVVNFEAFTVPGSNHDSLCDSAPDALEKILLEAKRTSVGGE